MTASPLFSIATVCLNAEAHIAQAVESVAGQSFGDYEYVVVDGGSSDHTIDVIEALAPDLGGRLRLTSEADSGLYDAMNKALRRATGAYIVFLGADDMLEPDALAIVARALEATPPPDIVAGATFVFGPNGSWTEPPSNKVRRGLPQRAPSRHQSIFVRRDKLVALGGFDLTYRIAADYELYLRLAEWGATQVLVPQTLSRFGLGGVSSSERFATAREYRDARIAHGANAAIENVVMLKSALGATLFAAWKWLTGPPMNERS